MFPLGAVSLRVDTVRFLGSGESSRLSLQGVCLSVVKSLTENMEPCCPASETPNPILQLTTLAFCYHITTLTLEVVYPLIIHLIDLFSELAWPCR